MGFATYRHIREQALDLIKKAGLNEPPIDVRSLASHLGLEVVEFSTDSWFYGMLMKFHGDFYIVANKMMPETRKRMVIAHEIGHYCLHKGSLSFTGQNERDYLHKEADTFATELCLPAPLVQREAMKWVSDHRFLAELFGVSETTMLKRLEELKLMPKGRFAWVYPHCKTS